MYSFHRPLIACLCFYSLLKFCKLKFIKTEILGYVQITVERIILARDDNDQRQF